METINRYVTARHPKYGCETEFNVSHDDDPHKNEGGFTRTATIVINTGAACIQCYATVDQLRDLAAVFAEAAEAVAAVPKTEAA